jgi:hypothetical protein
MQNEDRVNLVAALTRQVRENLNFCVPSFSETVFTELVKDQPNRGKDYTKWLVDLLNYWSNILNITFEFRYDVQPLLARLDQ